VLDPIVAYSALAAFGLVGAAVLAVGFALRREAEQFFTENKEDAKAVRATLQGRFHQQFATEVNSAIAKAGQGATTVELNVLQDRIAKAALEPAQETGVGKLSDLLADRETAWGAFTEARDKKMDTSACLVGIGIVLIVSGLAFILPPTLLSADGGPLGVLLGFVGVLLVVLAASRYSDHLKASKTFFDFCDRELKDL
jgi:hypothetical protein